MFLKLSYNESKFSKFVFLIDEIFFVGQPWYQTTEVMMIGKSLSDN